MKYYWLAIQHVKEVSKKKVTFAKIEQFTKRNKIEISTEELNRIIENLVNTGVMQMQGENQNTTYNLSEQPESNDLVLMSHTQEPSSISSQKFYIKDRDGEVAHGPAVSVSNINIEQDPMNAIRKDITSLKRFQETVAKKLYELEKALLISQETNPNSSIGDVGSGDENCNCNGKSDFTLNLLKRRMTNLENEILKKDAIIDYLTKQLFASKSNSLNNKTNLQKDNTNEANKNKTAYDKTRTQGNIGNNSKRKVVVTGDSVLNGINERGLSKHQNVKIQNFPGGTTETILDKVETLVAEKPDCIIIHAGTNDIVNGINSLNSVKTFLKKSNKLL